MESGTVSRREITIMKQCLGICSLVGMALLVAMAAWAYEADADRELDGFARTLREGARVDRIGYLVEVRTPPTPKAEDTILGLAGKILFAGPEGYLTHVDYARLERLKAAGLSVSLIDKKRLDDTAELWYLVWIDDEAKDKALQASFEPLFRHEKTRVIRIRPEDEQVLAWHSIQYSVVEETLLPTRIPVRPRPVKGVTVDPAIKALLQDVKKEEMVGTVQTLENCTSRWAYEPGNASATRWLEAELRKIGTLEVSTPSFLHQKTTFANVIGVQKGTREPDTVIVVCGHFDSSGGQWGPANKTAPGADDNGSGVAGVLHVARVAGRLALPYTVIYACMNVEELGLVGSKAFARTLAGQPGTKILGVLNMDMIADRDDNQVAVIGNTRSNWLIDVFRDAALAYTGLTSKCLYDSKIWNSDHSSFWNIGASAILTIEGHPDMSPHYHKPTDLVRNMSPEMMEKVTRSNLATLLTLNRVAGAGAGLARMP